MNQDLKDFRLVCQNVRKLGNIVRRIRLLSDNFDDDAFYIHMTPSERRKVDKYLTSCGFELQCLLTNQNKQWRQLGLMLFTVMFGAYRVDWSQFVVETEPWDEIKRIGKQAMLEKNFGTKVTLPATSYEFFHLINISDRATDFRKHLVLFKLSLV